MINIRAWDIETIPNLDLVASLPEPEVALGNTKDPDKIKEKVKEAKEKQIEKMGLSPFYGRICSSSFFGEQRRVYKTIPEISDAAEIELINHVLQELSVGESEPKKIITWNGFNFDFRFLYLRAALLKVELPRNCFPLKYWLKKYSTDPHIDLMQELSGWSTDKTMNLNAAGLVFLGHGKTTRDYSTYVDLIKNGESDKISIDNLCDTELTFRIYEAVKNYIL